MDIRENIRKYRRVLQISRKPGKEEFLTSTKICALGIALIGFIGFVIFLAFILGLPGA
jgi:protein transport protein SEC61 subunit gamma-like protein